MSDTSVVSRIKQTLHCACNRLINVIGKHDLHMGILCCIPLMHDTTNTTATYGLYHWQAKGWCPCCGKEMQYYNKRGKKKFPGHVLGSEDQQVFVCDQCQRDKPENKKKEREQFVKACKAFYESTRAKLLQVRYLICCPGITTCMQIFLFLLQETVFALPQSMHVGALCTSSMCFC